MDTQNAILILFNTPGTLPAQRQGIGVEADAGVLNEVAAVEAALRELNRPSRTVGVANLREVCTVLASAPESAVFNLVESLAGDIADATLVPALCAAFDKAVTGNGAPAQFAALDKSRAKATLSMHGVRTPVSVVAMPGGVLPALPSDLGRVIVKPLMTDASEGIYADSVVDANDRELLRERVERIFAIHRQPALIEAYIHGRELNVSVMEGRDGRPQVLPLAEIEFINFKGDRPRIVDYDAKWDTSTEAYQNTRRRIPARLPAAAAAEVKRVALAAWHAFECSGYARVDMRLDAELNPYVLEVNPNPDITPDAGFCAALTAAGIPYTHFVDTCLRTAAARRHELDERVVPPPTPSPVTPETRARSTIRRTTAEDRDGLLSMLADTNFFHAHEIEIAQEVLEDALRDGPQGHYQSYTALVEDAPVGWICFGATPCTEGAYDIYWLAVSPAHQRRRIGRDLLSLAEREIAERGGRLSVVETAGRAQYKPSQTFYVSAGYRIAAVVDDFYAPGDAKIILTKAIPRDS